MSADAPSRRERLVSDLAPHTASEDTSAPGWFGGIAVVADLVAACDDPAVACDSAYALGWFHPGTVTPERLAGFPPDHRRVVLSGLLLGLSQRCGEVTAAALADDPRLEQPVHQMLGARLADEAALRSALDTALAHVVDRGAAGSGPAAVLALGLELAGTACETAMLAASTARTRDRLHERRRWLADIDTDGNPLELLDEVAEGLAAVEWT